MLTVRLIRIGGDIRNEVAIRTEISNLNVNIIKINNNIRISNIIKEENSSNPSQKKKNSPLSLMESFRQKAF